MGTNDDISAIPVLPSSGELDNARSAICRTLPEDSSDHDTSCARLDSLVPGLNRSSESSRYYGFVTGGATTIAQYADNIVSKTDQNVQVHLPNETISTDVEEAALNMLCQLVHLDPSIWHHRTFPTGATAANLIGISLGREHVVVKAGERLGLEEGSASIAQLGLFKAMRAAEIDDIQILTTVPHSSIKKVASVVGLGHDSVKDVGRHCDDHRHLFDFNVLEDHLKRARTGSIITVSCPEVNMGLFATEGLSDFQRLRHLADQYGAWIHVDAAMGLLARILSFDKNPEYARIVQGVEGLELADSIAGDGHKLLNVPYDCGVFLSRHLATAIKVFQNPGAAYLTGGGGVDIPSPLNIGIENSRRFRALPVYANLIHYGRKGYENMLIRQIKLSRRIARFIQEHPEYELLPPFVKGSGERSLDTQKQIDNIFMIVCFRALHGSAREKLATYIKDMRVIYVSGTTFWDGKSAVRIAVSNWQADEDEDFGYIEEVLNAAPVFPHRLGAAPQTSRGR